MTVITVMTFNIRHGRGMNGKVNLAKTGQVLDKYQADIICLQEVDRGRVRSGFRDQAAWLADTLQYQHVFGPVPNDRHQSYGNAILFRHKMLKQINYILPAELPERALLAIELEIAGQKLVMLNTHLGLNRRLRREQVEKFMIPLMSTISLPAILCGDFNEGPEEEGVAGLLSCWQDSFLANRAPFCFSYPADQPRQRLDYILCNHFCQVREYENLPSQASDHWPVVARIAL